MTVAEAVLMPDDASVRLAGTVLAAPGAIGTQYFYLADASGGIQAYKYDAVFPDLPVGSRVGVTGVLSTNRGERRVKLSGDASIARLDGEADVSARALPVAGIVSAHVGLLVRTEGSVIDRSDRTLTLEDGGQRIVVRAAKADGDLSRFPRGTRIRAAGIVSSTDGALRLLARSADDLKAVPEPAAVAAGTAGKAARDAAGRTAGIAIALATLGGLLALAFRPLLTHARTLYARHRLVRVAAEDAR